MYSQTEKQIFVDLEAKRITSNNVRDRLFWQGCVMFALNQRDVVLSDNKGTKVVISPTGQNSERFSWRVVKYQFPEGYEKSSLYPTIAWKKDGNETRTFLTQQEAMPYIREFGLDEEATGDVKLGEIGVAYFARDIIKGWESKMKLAPLEGAKKSIRGDDFEQPMGGAQMPGWVAVEQHKAELLKSETSVLARSEKHLASVS